MKRKKVSKRLSRKIFSKSANRPNKRNIDISPSRGGIRLALTIAFLVFATTGCKFCIKDFEQSFGELNMETSR